MSLENKFRAGLKWILDNKKKTLASLVLAGLAGITISKDNVHLGSTTLNNAGGNHYVWGLFPSVKIIGDTNTSVRTYGLVAINTLNGKITGDMSTYGLIGGNNSTGDNSSITGDMGAYGLLVGINSTGNNSSITGDMGAYGLIGGENSTGNNSSITGDMGAYGLLVGINSTGNNSSITGDMSAYGLFTGNNSAGDNSPITGDITSRGISAITPVDWGFLSNTQLNLENYIVKKEEASSK